MCYFFQVQTIAPQGNLGDVQLLTAVHPVLPAVSLWGSGVNTETTAPGTVAHTILASAPVSISTTVQVEAQTPALIPAQKQASGLVSTPVSASGSTLEPPNVSSTNSDASLVIGNSQLSVPGMGSAPISVMLPAQTQAAGPALASATVAVSVPAPALQPAGIQTTVSMSECASLATTQQNLDTTSTSSTLQQESCVEVGIKTK